MTRMHNRKSKISQSDNTGQTKLHDMHVEEELDTLTGKLPKASVSKATISTAHLNGESLDTSALETWLWEAACSIRGATDAPKFKDFILPFIFFKRLSDVFDDEFQFKFTFSIAVVVLAQCYNVICWHQMFSSLLILFVCLLILI